MTRLIVFMLLLDDFYRNMHAEKLGILIVRSSFWWSESTKKLKQTGPRCKAIFGVLLIFISQLKLNSVISAVYSLKRCFALQSAGHNLAIQTLSRAHQIAYMTV